MHADGCERLRVLVRAAYPRREGEGRGGRPARGCAAGTATSRADGKASGRNTAPSWRGGSSAETGFDCSGFVRAMYERTVGLLLPRRANEQAAATQTIEPVRPGSRDDEYVDDRSRSLSDSAASATPSRATTPRTWDPSTTPPVPAFDIRTGRRRGTRPSVPRRPPRSAPPCGASPTGSPSPWSAPSSGRRSCTGSSRRARRHGR